MRLHGPPRGLTAQFSRPAGNMSIITSSLAIGADDPGGGATSNKTDLQLVAALAIVN